MKKNNQLRLRVLGILVIGIMLSFSTGIGSQNTLFADLKPANGKLISDTPSQPQYVHGEIIVKFKKPAADILEKGIEQGKDVPSELALPDSLSGLNAKYMAKKIKPIFRNFKKNRGKIESLKHKDKNLFTKKETHLLQRLNRAPKDAKIPDLNGVYKITLEDGQSIEEAIAEYKLDPNVEYAEPNYIGTFYTVSVPDDTRFNDQWALNNVGQECNVDYDTVIPPQSFVEGTPDADIDIPEAWYIYEHISDVIVAVVDTGVDYTHRDLAANMWLNLEEDINGNGIAEIGEAFSDTGIDGLYGNQEPNYDPILNPDPNGDNFDPNTNPAGTEGNHRYDLGEEFDDSGVDGVIGTYDTGEGNGIFDAGDKDFIDNDCNDYIDDIIGYDVGASDNSPMAEVGFWGEHGTKVAGLIAAEHNNGIDISGVCPDAKIMAVKNGYLQWQHNRPYVDTNAEVTAESIIYAVDNGADIISMSFGFRFGSISNVEYNMLEQAVDYAISSGVVCVAAAGNDNTYVNSIPAAFENVITVAATDANDEKASFSSYGAEIDVAAPGVNVISLTSRFMYLYYTGVEIDTRTGPFGGTSAATPMVSAIAALILANYPDANIEEVSTYIKAGADDLGTSGRDDYFGWGRVNAYNSLSLPSAANKPPIFGSLPDNIVVYAGQEVIFAFEALDPNCNPFGVAMYNAPMVPGALIISSADPDGSETYVDRDANGNPVRYPQNGPGPFTFSWTSPAPITQGYSVDVWFWAIDEHLDYTFAKVTIIIAPDTQAPVISTTFPPQEYITTDGKVPFKATIQDNAGLKSFRMICYDHPQEAITGDIYINGVDSGMDYTLNMNPNINNGYINFPTQGLTNMQFEFRPKTAFYNNPAYGSYTLHTYWIGVYDMSGNWTSKTARFYIYQNSGSGGYPGGDGCFLAGTPILMADGTVPQRGLSPIGSVPLTKPIEDIKVGDTILAYDEDTGTFKPDKVKRVFVFPEEPGYLVINGHIKVTPKHRFLMKRGQTPNMVAWTDPKIGSVPWKGPVPFYEWREAGSLKLGDKLLTSKDKLEPITSIDRIEAKVTVYNLEVNPYHTFIANGVVVHNIAYKSGVIDKSK